MRANGSPGEELPPLSQSDAKKSQIPDGPRSEHWVGEASPERGRGRKYSDCRDHRGLLDASGSAGGDDYPDWGTSFRPISLAKCG
jgi:hypothetical protein